MALSINSLRNLIITSLYGRRLGLDVNEFMVGPKDIRNPVEDFSTTTASTAVNYGVTRVLTSGSSQNGQYTLQAPQIGVQKILYQQSTSTGTMQFQAGSGISILAASDGSTKAVITLLGNGAAATLEALTSALWAVVGQTGSSASPLVAYTTST